MINLWFVTSWALLNFLLVSSAPDCRRPNCPDEEYTISVSGEPEYFVPGSTYTVRIESKCGFGFNSFFLTSDVVESNKKERTFSSSANAGAFVLMPDDNSTQFCQDCINGVVQKDDNYVKDTVQVIWIAPQIPKCIVLSATVTSRMNDSSSECVTKAYRQFCRLDVEEEINVEEGSRKETAEWSKCCSCHKASYLMAIEGIWSKELHPRGFPTDQLFLTHFSDFIGVSHGMDLPFWKEGDYATEGFRQLAEFGSTEVLEAELREKKRHWKSLIKASGLWYPKIKSNTTTKFWVDPNNNLISFAAMIGPSPDWVVGVPRLNLCNATCDWQENLDLDLYAYDAGTDSGRTYMAANQPTIPRERIQRITSSYPDDPQSPFYDMAGKPMKPLARLHLKRDQIVKGSCQEIIKGPKENVEDIEKPECAVSGYSSWSPCSVSCGTGVRRKQRRYLDERKATLANCTRILSLEEQCTVEGTTCASGDEEEDNLFQIENCTTTDWSAWSDCSVSCGIGFMTRTRRFLIHSSYKLCPHIRLVEKKKCMEPSCKVTIVEKNNTNCPVTEWTDWSPCVAATCGSGTRVRIRYLLSSTNSTQYEHCLNSTVLEERKKCQQPNACNVHQMKADDICNMPLEEGPCRGFYKRWYFNRKEKECLPFAYGGCRGNKNNFFSFDDCNKLCARFKTAL